MFQTQQCDSTYPGRCDFSFGICAFWTVENGDLDWSYYKGMAPELGTGPSVDHTTHSESGKKIL